MEDKHIHITILNDGVEIEVKNVTTPELAVAILSLMKGYFSEGTFK
jgi:hypothetical protein